MREPFHNLLKQQIQGFFSRKDTYTSKRMLDGSSSSAIPAVLEVSALNKMNF